MEIKAPDGSVYKCSSNIGDNIEKVSPALHIGAYKFYQLSYLDPHNVQNLFNLAICHISLYQFLQGYNFLLQAFYEAELQNVHEFDHDMEVLTTKMS